MKSLFVRMYLGIIFALFLGVFVSEYIFNKANYEESILEENYYFIDDVHGYLLDEIQSEKGKGASSVLEKWEDISGYDIRLIKTSDIVDNVHSVLSKNFKRTNDIELEIKSLSKGELWAGTDADFFEDRILFIAPYPAKNLWLAYSLIEQRTQEENTVFVVDQLSLLLTFSLVLVIFLRPIVNTMNELNIALIKFKEGKLDISVPVKGPKPLALLNLQFNKMASALKAKMEGQELMANAMSHEIKSPITRLRFALDMAIKSDHIDDKNELLAEMDIDLTDLDSLTTELLTLAKVAGSAKDWKYEIVNYKDLIEQEMAKISKYQLGIHFGIFGDASGVACARYISRVFSNILGNAHKYARLKIEVTLKEQDGRCYITIEDDGEGMSEQDQEKLFVPFYRASTSKNKQLGGHGIGLAIAWNIIKHHQGEVQVDRGSLGGLRVRISLPTDPLSI